MSSVSETTKSPKKVGLESRVIRKRFELELEHCHDAIARFSLSGGLFFFFTELHHGDGGEYFDSTPLSLFVHLYLFVMHNFTKIREHYLLFAYRPFFFLVDSEYLHCEDCALVFGSYP